MALNKKSFLLIIGFHITRQIEGFLPIHSDDILAVGGLIFLSNGPKQYK